MTAHIPTFPPLLNGHKVTTGEHPKDWVMPRVTNAALSAGDFAWAESSSRLTFALVMEPEVGAQSCHEMVFAAAVAFGDAAGALCPPEISIKYQWPSVILMNDAQIGSVDLTLSDAEADNGAVPDWLILSCDIEVRPEKITMNPGKHVNRTTMWDEGCGDIEVCKLLESTSRHLVNWVHSWSEDGFQPIHKAWSERLYKTQPFAEGIDGSEFVGLDETGNALRRNQDIISAFSVADGLAKLRNRKRAA